MKSSLIALQRSVSGDMTLEDLIDERFGPGIAISALWYLTKEEIPLKTIERIEHELPPEEFKKLVEVKAIPIFLGNSHHYKLWTKNEV